MTEPQSRDVGFSRKVASLETAEVVKPSWWSKLDLHVFGPRNALDLALEERRQLNGLRKLTVLIALIVLGLSVYSCYLFAFEGFGCPKDDLIYVPGAWFAYLGRIVASVLVLLIVLVALFKLVSKEKQSDSEKVPFEVLNQVKDVPSDLS